MRRLATSGALNVQRLSVEHVGTIEQNRNNFHRKKGATELVTPVGSVLRGLSDCTHSIESRLRLHVDVAARGAFAFVAEDVADQEGVNLRIVRQPCCHRMARRMKNEM